MENRKVIIPEETICRNHKEEMKFYNKEANKRAKKVNDIKQKYGL